MNQVLAASLHKELRSRIEDLLAPLIEGRAGDICLIDPPAYSNVGDSAILLGELDFLKRRFPASRLRSFDIGSYSPACNDLIEKSSIILIHGGGNFGDIWPQHQRLRLSLIKAFPHKRIIQLPQSVSFSSNEAREETARAIAGHPDFHFLVRDTVSRDFALRHFDCAVALSPDMAFCMDPLEREPATVDYLCLLRTDKEVAADHSAIVEQFASRSHSIEVADWLEEPYTRTLRLDRKLQLLTHAHPRLTWPVNSLMLSVRRRYAEARVQAGVELLSRGRTVVTDRLHAHIMSSLLGIPHFLFDSLDGKVSAFHRTWTHADPGATLMS